MVEVLEGQKQKKLQTDEGKRTGSKHGKIKLKPVVIQIYQWGIFTVMLNKIMYLVTLKLGNDTHYLHRLYILPVYY